MIEFKLDLQLSKIDLETALPQAIDAFLQEVLDSILKWANENLVRNGSVNTGQLLKSGRVEYNKAKFEGSVIYSAPYASFVEFGTRPHWAPLGPSLPHTTTKRGGIKITSTPDPSTNPLDYYAWRKGKRKAIQTKYGVHTAFGFGLWLKIARRGTDPKPFLRPAGGRARIRLRSIAKKYGLEVR